MKIECKWWVYMATSCSVGSIRCSISTFSSEKVLRSRALTARITSSTGISSLRRQMAVNSIKIEMNHHRIGSTKVCVDWYLYFWDDCARVEFAFQVAWSACCPGWPVRRRPPRCWPADSSRSWRPLRIRWNR